MKKYTCSENFWVSVSGTATLITFSLQLLVNLDPFQCFENEMNESITLRIIEKCCVIFMLFLLIGGLVLGIFFHNNSIIYDIYGHLTKSISCKCQFLNVINMRVAIIFGIVTAATFLLETNIILLDKKALNKYNKLNNLTNTSVHNKACFESDLTRYISLGCLLIANSHNTVLQKVKSIKEKYRKIKKPDMCSNFLLNSEELFFFILTEFASFADIIDIFSDLENSEVIEKDKIMKWALASLGGQLLLNFIETENDLKDELKKRKIDNLANGNANCFDIFFYTSIWSAILKIIVASISFIARLFILGESQKISTIEKIPTIVFIAKNIVTVLMSCVEIFFGACYSKYIFKTAKRELDQEYMEMGKLENKVNTSENSNKKPKTDPNQNSNKKQKTEPSENSNKKQKTDPSENSNKKQKTEPSQNSNKKQKTDPSQKSNTKLNRKPISNSNSMLHSHQIS